MAPVLQTLSNAHTDPPRHPPRRRKQQHQAPPLSLPPPPPQLVLHRRKRPPPALPDPSTRREYEWRRVPAERARRDALFGAERRVVLCEHVAQELEW